VSYTFGFIGTGNMGSALAQAAGRVLPSDQIVLSDQSLQKAQALADRLHCLATDGETAARESQFLFLGVKPHMMSALLKDLTPTLKARSHRPVLVSMAAGLTLRQLEEMVPRDFPFIRIMPNTPVSEGAGVILYVRNQAVSDDQLSMFTSSMSGAGNLYPLDESLMDAGSAVSGCGPAFAYLFVDALADGGVACGLSRNDALNFAAQTVLGAASMILSTGKHPEQLKNDVCSPGGSTIQGVRTLEQRALRAACMDAVIAAFEKTKELGK
jgi:pyrroline-5-carboxylate reductase